MPELLLLPLPVLTFLAIRYRHPLFERYLHRRIRRAARVLPKDQREELIQGWQSELHYFPGIRSKFSFVRGLPSAARSIRADLDPVWAASDRRTRQFFGSFALIAAACVLLAQFGVAPHAMRLLASTTQAAVFVAVFTAITTLAVLSLRGRRPERRRAVALIALGSLAAILSLLVLTTWSALHPETTLLLLAAAWTGHLFGKADFTPRFETLT